MVVSILTIVCFLLFLGLVWCIFSIHQLTGAIKSIIACLAQEEDELRSRRNTDVVDMKNCSNCKHLAKPFNLCCYSLGDEDYDCHGKQWEETENA